MLLPIGPTVRPADAQVGHDPARSPFRDLRRGGGPRVWVGYLSGERGRVGVGHSDGTTWGLRYELPVGGAARFTFGFAYAETDRFVVDPTKDSAVRKSGPFPDDAMLVDAGLQFLLTGPKTWRGFAPYLGAALGVAISSGSPTDSSGYQFGTKLTLGPGIGLRWYPTRRVNLQADARLLFWRLRYPPDYQQALSPDGTTVLPARASDTEWATQRWISLGLGWTF